MEHKFNIRHAQQYGVNEAILISNFAFWIEKNKANDRHIHEGRTWTYNSMKAMTLLFPYWTDKQIRRAICNLIDANVLLTGNFNENPHNRTLWYAFVDEEQFLDGKMDFPKQENRKDQTGKSKRPNGQISNGTDNKPDNYQIKGADKSADRKRGMIPDLPETLREGRIPEAWGQFLQHRREMKKPVTATSANRIMKVLEQWKDEQGPGLAADALEMSVRNGWQGVFRPKVTNGQTSTWKPAQMGNHRPVKPDYSKDF